MQVATLEQIEKLVDQLSMIDQARLLEYLTPRVVQTLVSSKTTEPSKTHVSEAWCELFRIGDEITAMQSPSDLSLTQAVITSRR